MIKQSIFNTTKSNSLLHSLGFEIEHYDKEHVQFYSIEKNEKVTHCIARENIVDFINEHFKGELYFYIEEKPKMDVVARQQIYTEKIIYNYSFAKQPGGQRSRMKM